MNQKPRILLIYTGGTIGMEKNPETGALQPLDFARLSKKIPELQQIDCELSTTSLAEPIDSSSMSPTHWAELAGLIEENYTSHDGFVVLHGSDTMSYTASAMSFMLENLGKPLVFTGSQLPIGVLRTDARENIITSVELAAARDENGRPLFNEVAIYFEFFLFRANRTYKYSSQDFDAFDSPNCLPLGTAGVAIKMNHEMFLPPPTASFSVFKSLETGVAVLPLFPGVNPEIAENILATSGLKALILQTYGAGNAPQSEKLMKVFEEAVNRGVLLVNVSQCRSGTVEQSKYETGRQLAAIGVISAGDMTLESTLTKLMYLFGKYKDRERVARLLAVSLSGERS